MNAWNTFDSPALLIYRDRVAQNIDAMIRIAGGTSRLMPHVKTHKMPAVMQMMVDRGILRFKAATLAEAELAAAAGASSVLIAHQLVGPKVERLSRLVNAYPNTHFSSLVDCDEGVHALTKVLPKARVYLDINNGMNRSGHEVNATLAGFFDRVLANPALALQGLHIYDGHITDADFAARMQRISQGMDLLHGFLKAAQQKMPDVELVCGGSPAFTVHLQVQNRTLSPGTSVFWDWGYGDKFHEQPFQPAAFVLTRVISKPLPGLVTVDMGHKAVAAENPIDFRIRFPQYPDLRLVSQSEEHGVLQTDRWNTYKVGDALLGIPYHVCPTVNLYDEAYVVENDACIGLWEVTARRRKITY